MDSINKIEIWQVENGFMVLHAYDPANFGAERRPRLVFQSFAALTAWLGNHFKHRATSVPSDPNPQGTPTASTVAQPLEGPPLAP